MIGNNLINLETSNTQEHSGHPVSTDVTPFKLFNELITFTMIYLRFRLSYFLSLAHTHSLSIYLSLFLLCLQFFSWFFKKAVVVKSQSQEAIQSIESSLVTKIKKMETERDDKLQAETKRKAIELHRSRKLSRGSSLGTTSSGDAGGFAPLDTEMRRESSDGSLSSRGSSPRNRVAFSSDGEGGQGGDREEEYAALPYGHVGGPGLDAEEEEEEGLEEGGRRYGRQQQRADDRMPLDSERREDEPPPAQAHAASVEEEEEEEEEAKKGRNAKTPTKDNEGLKGEATLGRGGKTAKNDEADAAVAPASAPSSRDLPTGKPDAAVAPASSVGVGRGGKRAKKK